MYTKGVIASVVLCVSFVVVSAWPYDDQYWQLARRSFGYCEESGGKCFSTGQCCDGYVCAAFDDVLEDEADIEEGENPEIPGFCVKEKDLQPCHRHAECGSGRRCVPLGRNGEKYCVRNSEQPQRQTMPNVDRGSNMGRPVQKPTGDLGASCEDDSDCKAFTARNEKMCCQRQRRGRTTARQICNIITPLSNCISKRK